MEEEKDFVREYQNGVSQRLGVVAIVAFIVGAFLFCVAQCKENAEKEFNERPVYEISNVIEITGKDVVVITFTNGDSYEAKKYVMDYGLKPGLKIRFKDYSGVITKVKVVE